MGLRSRVTRPAAAVGVLALALPLLTSCNEQDGAESLADDLAAALTKGDVSELRVVGGNATTGKEADASLQRVIAGMDQTPMEVSVEGVSLENDDRHATATLNWTWDLPGDDDWNYQSTAKLVGPDDWSVAWSPSLVAPELHHEGTLDLQAVDSRPGDIVGAGGAKLVTEREVLRYGLDKSQVKPAQQPRSARRIAAEVGIGPADYVKQVEAAGDEAFVEAIVLRAAEARRQVTSAYDDIPGAISIRDQLPLAPTKEFAAPILGSVGEATAEMIEKSDGEIVAGQQVGLSGLEARYDDDLAGTPELEVTAENPGGSESLHTSRGEAGKPLRVTLDESLQRRAEQALAQIDGQGNASALVALDPKTGDIRAAANGPGESGLNAATYGRYPPGSTFKIVAALALLRSGMSPDTPVDCPATTVVDGKTFKNYDDYPSSSLGRITLREAIAQSCNTAIVAQADKLDDGALSDAAAALGVGIDHDLGFPAYFGQVPEPSSKTEAAADLIGQGKVLASPMAMAAVAASVRAGSTVTPRLLTEHDDEAAGKVKQPLTKDEAAALRTLMAGVIDGGSGAFLAGVPGVRGAKTGTAEYGSPGSGGELATHAWMIATTDELAVAVFVETGESGSQTAGPVLEQFLRSAGAGG